MLERSYEINYELQNFLGWQDGQRKRIGFSYLLVLVNNNFMGWCPPVELVLNKGLMSPAGWCLQILLHIGV